MAHVIFGFVHLAALVLTCGLGLIITVPLHLIVCAVEERRD